MTCSSSARRTLFMHAAHRTIGISGGRTPIAPYFPLKTLAHDGLAAPPLRVALAAFRPGDSMISATLTLFERAMQLHRDIECRRVELNDADTKHNSPIDAACLVLCEGGFHIARHLSDIDLASRAVGESLGDDAAKTTAEVTAENDWHPVLMGVEAFTCRFDMTQHVCIPPDATVLMSVRTAEAMRPLAWARHRRHGRLFQTLLGSPADLRQPAFIRLMMNAIAWVGC